MTQRPDPRTPAEKAVDTAILRAQYDASPVLQAEFGVFDRFRAYSQARAEGRAKIHQGARNGQ